MIIFIVPLTISYHLYFLWKFRACYITGQWPEFTVNNATLYLRKLSWYFFVFFLFFCFYHFNFLFWWSIEFPQQNISQSETGIGDRKLSVELCVIEITLRFGCSPVNLLHIFRNLFLTLSWRRLLSYRKLVSVW